MGFFRTTYRGNAHFVSLSDISVANTTVFLHFDTGAVATVISIEALSNEPIDKEWFSKQLNGRATQRTFRSATGNVMSGYLVCAKNVTISNASISQFYYYLIVDVNYRVGLLGDDFISKCEFSHRVDGEMDVTFFDDAKYVSQFENAASEEEVYSLLGNRFNLTPPSSC